MISIGICAHNLPFMTLGETERKTYHGDDLPDGAPPFSDLLTFDRFLHRAGLLKKQTEAFVSHPLFSELVRLTPRPVGAANGADKHDNPDDDEVLAVTDVPSVRAYTGTSVGNLNLILPTEYPLPPDHPLSPFSPASHPLRAGYATPCPAIEADMTPRILAECRTSRLHVFPAELYLSASTLSGRLVMPVYYDRNVYEDGVVKEWLDKVRGAVLWYLGQTHGACRDHGGHDVRHRIKSADPSTSTY